MDVTQWCDCPTDKGVEIINGECPPGVFSKGSQTFGQKNKGSQIFLGKSKGSQIPSNQSLNKIFFEISIFLEVTDPNVTKIVTILDIRKADEIEK